jgi:hypothetical protein
MTWPALDKTSQANMVGTARQLLTQHCAKKFPASKANEWPLRYPSGRSNLLDSHPRLLRALVRSSKCHQGMVDNLMQNLRPDVHATSLEDTEPGRPIRFPGDKNMPADTALREKHPTLMGTQTQRDTARKHHWPARIRGSRIRRDKVDKRFAQTQKRIQQDMAHLLSYPGRGNTNLPCTGCSRKTGVRRRAD